MMCIFQQGRRCGGPLSLSSRPLSPRPYNAAAPKGPAFLFLKLLLQNDLACAPDRTTWAAFSLAASLQRRADIRDHRCRRLERRQEEDPGHPLQERLRHHRVPWPGGAEPSDSDAALRTWCTSSPTPRSTLNRRRKTTRPPTPSCASCCSGPRATGSGKRKRDDGDDNSSAYAEDEDENDDDSGSDYVPD